MQHPGMPAAAPPPSSSTGVIALVLSLVGCVVMPLLSVIVGLALSKSDSAFLGIGAVLGLGAIIVVIAIVMAIVALARGRGGQAGQPGKISAIIALIVSVVSLPVGIFAGFWAILFAAGGGAHGRPFRARGEALRTPTTSGHAWSERGPRPALTGLDPDSRSALAEAWLADAALEHASVAAFGALALDLIALGAPAALVRRSHEAALDEIAHAEDCFALASAYAGRSLTAAPFPEVRAHLGDETAKARLTRVAVDSAVDGCVGEATAAAAAREAVGRASDPVVRAVLERIAADEQRHADYAWDLLRWCMETGDDDVSRAVELALSRSEGAPPSAFYGRDLRAHGRIHASSWNTARTSAHQSLVARLEEAR